MEVFISYSHEDEKWLKEIIIHLGILRQKGFDFWYDKNIQTGRKYIQEINPLKVLVQAKEIKK